LSFIVFFVTVLPPDEEPELEEPDDDLPTDVRPLAPEDDEREDELLVDLITVLPPEEDDVFDFGALIDDPDLVNVRVELLLTVFPDVDSPFTFFAAVVIYSR